MATRATKRATKKPSAKQTAARVTNPSSRAAPWNKPNPKPPGARVRLSAAAKAQARARAEKAGRRYPNLVDNMWAARRAGR